jgi:sugar phosphate isomerase/epimerase
VDEVEYVRRYRTKTPLLHLKDVASDGPNWLTPELGQGQARLREAFTAASPQWLVIEQDYSLDPLGSAQRNFQWLRRNLAEQSA